MRCVDFGSGSFWCVIFFFNLKSIKVVIKIVLLQGVSGWASMRMPYIYSSREVQTRAMDPLGLELQTVLSCSLWMLRIKQVVL